jgi:putative RNA methyltransferase
MENKPNFETGEGLTIQNDTRNVVDKYRGLTVDEIKSDLNKSRHSFHIAVENFQHDFNIGTIARNANAFNAAGIHIIGKKHWNRRGAMKTEAYMNVFHHKTVADFISWAKENGLILIAIDNQKGSKNLQDSELPKKSVLVFGNESDGLSNEMIKACKQMISIEQFGSTRSVNVGVASGILMYEFVRRNYIEK